MAREPDRTKRKGPWQALGWASQLSAIPLEIAVCAFLGYSADQKLGTEPWLLITAGMVGLCVSMIHLWQLVRAIDRSSGSPSGKSR